MIIGFTGYKSSGKTTAANTLKKDFEVLNFKDPLIEEIKDNFLELLVEISKREGMSIDSLFEKKPPLMRKLMQNYGTDVRRKDDKDYWVDRYADGICKLGDDVVTDDVRFVNEAHILKKLGGIIIRIVRPGQENKDLHESEKDTENIKEDYTIINDGSITQLGDTVALLIEDLKK